MKFDIKKKKEKRREMIRNQAKKEREMNTIVLRCEEWRAGEENQRTLPRVLRGEFCDMTILPPDYE